LYDIVKSTTLEFNKSHVHNVDTRRTARSVRRARFSEQETRQCND
jgi:hypothetical protein